MISNQELLCLGRLMSCICVYCHLPSGDGAPVTIRTPQERRRFCARSQPGDWVPQFPQMLISANVCKASQDGGPASPGDGQASVGAA